MKVVLVTPFRFEILSKLIFLKSLEKSHSVQIHNSKSHFDLKKKLELKSASIKKNSRKQSLGFLKINMISGYSAIKLWHYLKNQIHQVFKFHRHRILKGKKVLPNLSIKSIQLCMIFDSLLQTAIPQEEYVILTPRRRRI